MRLRRLTVGAKRTAAYQTYSRKPSAPAASFRIRVIRAMPKTLRPGVRLRQMARKRNIDELQNEIQELFADMWQVSRFTGVKAGFRPQIDCYRTTDPPELVVLVELAGVDPESIELVVAEGMLQVSGERVRPRGGGHVYQQMELDYGAFRRQIQLGDDVDVTKALATYEQGILKVVAPIAERTRPLARVAIVVTRT
jgi:HSP20 family protein